MDPDITILLTLTTAGADTGPFDIYTNSDDFENPIATNVSKSDLLSGYTCMVVPSDATIVRAKSKGLCTNYDDAVINGLPTPTPTPTPPPTPTPTPTPTPPPTVYMYTGTTNNYVTTDEACGVNTDRSYFAYSNNLIVGDRIYEDVDCTIPVVGDPRYYKKLRTTWIGGFGSRVCKIDASGYIVVIFPCPEIPPTPTPIPD